MWVFNKTSCAFYTILSTKQLLLLPNLKMFANLFSRGISVHLVISGSILINDKFTVL